MKRCPFCAEEIQEAAIKCRHCGEMLKQDVSVPTAPTANIFTASPVPITRRVGYGFVFAFLWFGINMWIPIVGWFLLIFTPCVFLVPLFGMKTERSGLCPYCGSKLSHFMLSRSLKCPKCKQRVIVTETQFVKA